MIPRLIIRSLIILLSVAHSIWLVTNGHWLLGVAEHIVLISFLLWGTLFPNSRLFGPIQHSVKNGVALSIDDGPDPLSTPILLDLLDEFKAKATFFLIGIKAEKHPELVQEIQARGHTIGNHTWSHPQASFWAAGPIRTYREINRCQNTLKKITGESPSIFRAPVGHSNFFVHPIIKSLKLSLVGWNCRGFDAVETSPEIVLEKIRNEIDEGSLILAHDATTISESVVRGILEEVKKRGYSLVATTR